MVYPHKWSPISYMSSAGQRKHTAQRPMFYRWTTQPTNKARTYGPYLRAVRTGSAYRPRMSRETERGVKTVGGVASFARCELTMRCINLDADYAVLTRARTVARTASSAVAESTRPLSRNQPMMNTVRVTCGH